MRTILHTKFGEREVPLPMRIGQFVNMRIRGVTMIGQVVELWDCAGVAHAKVASLKDRPIEARVRRA